MTRGDIFSTVNTISSVLKINPPRIKYASTHNGVFLEAGLYQGWELVVFNPDFIESADDLRICITIAHEVRHIYQMLEVKKLLEGQSHVPEAENWLSDIRNGKSDTPEDSKETDATIFAHTFIAGVFDAGFDVDKVTDVENMRRTFAYLEKEPWYNEVFDKVIFYEKERSVFIGKEDLLTEALNKN